MPCLAKTIREEVPAMKETGLQRHFKEARSAATAGLPFLMRMGKILFPEKHIWDYEMLGPLTWLDIPEEELKKLLNSYYELMEDEKNIELLRTLKVYLENNMNYSITAEKTYAHINTIRKRIEKINSLIPVDWQNPVSRMKTELLLQFLEL